MGVEIVPLSKREIENEIFMNVMHSYWTDKDNPHLMRHHINECVGMGIRQSDAASALLSVLRQGAIDLTEDRKLIPGKQEPRGIWIAEHWDDPNPNYLTDINKPDTILER